MRYKDDMCSRATVLGRYSEVSLVLAATATTIASTGEGEWSEKVCSLIEWLEYHSSDSTSYDAMLVQIAHDCLARVKDGRWK